MTFTIDPMPLLPLRQPWPPAGYPRGEQQKHHPKTEQGQ